MPISLPNSPILGENTPAATPGAPAQNRVRPRYQGRPVAFNLDQGLFAAPPSTPQRPAPQAQVAPGAPSRSRESNRIKFWDIEEARELVNYALQIWRLMETQNDLSRVGVAEKVDFLKKLVQEVGNEHNLSEPVVEEAKAKIEEHHGHALPRVRSFGQIADQIAEEGARFDAENMLGR